MVGIHVHTMTIDSTRLRPQRAAMLALRITTTYNYFQSFSFSKRSRTPGLPTSCSMRAGRCLRRLLVLHHAAQGGAPLFDNAVRRHKRHSHKIDASCLALG